MPVDNRPAASKKIVISIASLLILVAMVSLALVLFKNSQPHRQSQTNTKVTTSTGGIKTGGSYNYTGHPADAVDSQGSWLKLSQDWTVPYDPNREVNYYSASDDKNVYVSAAPISGSAKATLTAYDGDRGNKIWEASNFPDNGAPIGYAVAGSGAIVQYLDNNKAAAYDVINGKNLWEVDYKADHDRLETPGIIIDGVYYFSESYTNNSEHRDRIVGVDVKSGQQKYILQSKAREDGSGFTQYVHAGYMVPRQISGGLLLGAHDLHALGAVDSSLKLKWQHNFEQSQSVDSTYGFGDVSVAVLDSAQSQDSMHLVALNSLTGAVLWDSHIKGYAGNKPTVTNGVLVTESNPPARQLYGYDLATGHLLWTSQADQPNGNQVRGDQPVTVDGSLFDGGRKLEIFNPKTGSLQFSQGYNYGTNSDIVSASGHVIVVFGNGVYGFK